MRHTKPYKISLDALRIQAILVNFICYGAAVALPVLEFIWIYHRTSRFSYETYVHWAICGACGLWALLAIFLSSQSMLAIHTVIGTALAAALAALNAIRYAETAFKCSMVQVAFQGCTSCVCAATNTCTIALLKAADCSSCQAVSLDVCQNYDSKKIVVAVTAAVTVIAMSIPVIYSFIIHSRIGNLRAIETTKINWLVLRVREQLSLLASGQAPSLDLEGLSSTMQRLKDCGVKENVALANTLDRSLVLAGYSVPKPATIRPQSPQSVFALEQTTAQEPTTLPTAWNNQVAPEIEAMMGGNQAYDMTATNPAQTMITYSTQELAADNVEQPVEDISGATFEAEPVAPTVKKSKSKKGKGEEVDVEMGEEAGAGEDGEKKKKKKKKKDKDGLE